MKRLATRDDGDRQQHGSADDACDELALPPHRCSAGTLTHGGTLARRVEEKTEGHGGCGRRQVKQMQQRAYGSL